MSGAYIDDVRVSNSEYNLDVAPFDKMPAEAKKRISVSLPQRPRQNITFILKGANPAIASALRVVTSKELKVKALDFDVSKVSTNDKEIILANLLDRISLIYLDQDVPLDAVFSLSCLVEDAETDYKVITSSQIVQVRGKKLERMPFERGYRIVELRPGRFMEIPEIHVIEGYGYVHDKFSLTSEFEYQPRDYVNINFLNSHGNIVNKLLSRQELFEVFRKQKIAVPKEFALNRPYNFRHHILVIPDAAYQQVMDDTTRQQVKQFPIVIELDNDVLHEYRSSEICPQEYYLGFTTYGNVDPIDMMCRTCQNIIERLTYLMVEKNLVIQTTGKATNILIKDEQYVIGELVKRAIFELDPTIGLVNSTLEHPQIRVVTINLLHPDPLGIFHDAIKTLIDTFTRLEKQFRGDVVAPKPTKRKSVKGGPRKKTN